MDESFKSSWRDFILPTLGFLTMLGLMFLANYTDPQEDEQPKEKVENHIR